MKNKLENLDKNLTDFAVQAVRTRSYSDEEGNFAALIRREMKALGYDEVFVDSVGNIVGRLGDGGKIIHFDGHMDTVEVKDAELWKVPPFEGRIVDGDLWGRGSVDMKSSLCAAVYAAAAAKAEGKLVEKTVYVTGSVCEEYCDGVNLKKFYEEQKIKPDYCIICEPSGGVITLGHKGKAQMRVITHGLSAHGSAPEKGVNAVYKMAEIISRVEALNDRLSKGEGSHGTIVLSDISCKSASLNAVPSKCEIYLDRRLALGESLEQVRTEMAEIIDGTDAEWEVGTLHHTSWNGGQLDYEPMHDPWKIAEDAPLVKAMCAAYERALGRKPDKFDFWDFGTNAVTPVSMGVPTIGLGAGDYKLAHMRDEHCPVSQIIDVCNVYRELIGIL